MIPEIFKNPMTSNGRIVCDKCGQPVWRGEQFDATDDGEVICRDCYYGNDEDEEE